jgi:hypothetical protein
MDLDRVGDSDSVINQTKELRWIARIARSQIAFGF